MSYKYIKKYFDFTLALILLFLFMLPIVIISLFITIRTKQFPIYIQHRGLTLNKFCFKIYKFRTIKKDLRSNWGNNASILYKPGLEKYIYPFGKFLRKTGLDEIPQLLNVIKGNMSFVGPRPLSIEDLKQIKEQFPSDYNKREQLKIKPGITGYWQINKDRFGDISYLIDSDKYYDKKKSFSFDLHIILKSILISLRGRHKDSILLNTNPTINIKSDKSYNPKLVNDVQMTR